MTRVWIIVIVVIVVVLVLVARFGIRPRGGRMGSTDRGERRRGRERPTRILFPFVASALSYNALEAALRIAHAERATLVPVFLARVPMTLPLQAPLPRQSDAALMLQEAIEQRAAAHEVPVDARIERGRDNRHALRQAIGACAHDRIVIAAAVRGCPGFDAGDVAWLLENAPGEILVLRAAGGDHVVGRGRHPSATTQTGGRARNAPAHGSPVAVSLR